MHHEESNEIQVRSGSARAAAAAEAAVAAAPGTGSGHRVGCMLGCGPTQIISHTDCLLVKFEAECKYLCGCQPRHNTDQPEPSPVSRRDINQHQSARSSRLSTAVSLTSYCDIPGSPHICSQGILAASGKPHEARSYMRRLDQIRVEPAGMRVCGSQRALRAK